MGGGYLFILKKSPATRNLLCATPETNIMADAGKTKAAHPWIIPAVATVATVVVVVVPTLPIEKRSEYVVGQDSSSCPMSGSDKQCFDVEYPKKHPAMTHTEAAAGSVDEHNTVNRPCIGHDYQVSFLPPSNTYDKLNKYMSSLTMPQGDVLWDPIQAINAAASTATEVQGEYDYGDSHNSDSLETFISQGKNSDASMLLMESLHKTGDNKNSSISSKNTSPAMQQFFQMATDVGVQVSEAEQEKFASFASRRNKDSSMTRWIESGAL
jgi:hypothetical protein